MELAPLHRGGAQTGSSSQSGEDARPSCYFIVHNVSKKHNVGTLARCATAFGVKKVGRCKLNPKLNPGLKVPWFQILILKRVAVLST